jgi:hypothetical protein
VRLVVDLKAMKENVYTHLETFRSICHCGEKDTPGTVLGIKIHDHEHHLNNEASSFFEEETTKLLDSSLAYVDARFGENEKHPVLCHFGFFDTRNWVLSTKPERDSFRETYGDRDLEALYSHFEVPLGQDANLSEGMQADWSQLKMDLLGSEVDDGEAHAFQPILPREYRTYKTRKFWGLMLQHYTDRYPYLLQLVTFYFLLPMDTSECERIFSLMNRLKTQARNRLQNKRLNDLMVCCRLVPPAAEWAENDILDCIRRWMSNSQKGRYLTKIWG